MKFIDFIDKNSIFFFNFILFLSFFSKKSLKNLFRFYKQFKKIQKIIFNKKICFVLELINIFSTILLQTKIFLIFAVKNLENKWNTMY